MSLTSASLQENTDSMNTLVTGGSGYLGTHVRNFFEANDFSRRSSLNILEESDARIVENYDVVIHLAAHMDKSPEGAEEVFPDKRRRHSQRHPPHAAWLSFHLRLDQGRLRQQRQRL
jgi:hypothetical protein